MPDHTEREREAREAYHRALIDRDQLAQWGVMPDGCNHAPVDAAAMLQCAVDDAWEEVRAAVRSAVLAEVREKVWPDEHLGSCPASTNLPTDGPDDMMWCDCGYEKFTALEATDGR